MIRCSLRAAYSLIEVVTKNLDNDVLTQLLIGLPVIFFALSVHEAAHAITAKWGGDMTAASEGRVTLNPLSHIDPIGTLLVPIASLFSGIPLIGWARPVPTVDMNYTRGKSYGVIVAMAGPFSNLLIALFSLALMLFLGWLMGQGYVPPGQMRELMMEFLAAMIVTNITLMFFNLIPIPPLDGSWLLWYWLVRGNGAREDLFITVRQYGTIILLALMWTGALAVYLTLIHSTVTRAIFSYVHNYLTRMI